MRSILLTVFLFIFFTSFSQSKEDLLKQYFLGIPVTDSFSAITNFIKTSPIFGIDSISKGAAFYSSYKVPTAFTSQGNYQTNVQAQNIIYFDSISNEFYDTAVIVTIMYRFSPTDKKAKNGLYKKLCKEFTKLYPYNYDDLITGKSLQTGENIKEEKRRLKQGQFDNYAELTLYSGYKQDQFHYVALRYDRRSVYQVAKPRLSSITIRSF